VVYLAYISILFAVFQLLNAVLNIVYIQKLKNKKPANKELVSVLIPARNEENNIGNLLESLQKLDDKNIEIIVFDDKSTDKTATIVEDYAKMDPRITLLKSKSLAKGWLGKNYACYSLAKHAKGTYFLFVDADVKLHTGIIGDAVYACKKYDLGLLSIFPKQIQQTFGEKVSVPIINYILLTLIPLVFVRISPYRSHAAANGQFMLFSAEQYQLLQPHKEFKNSAVEDINISRFYKKNKLKIACIASDSRITCRMYKSYGEALNGFVKNVFMFFGNRPSLAILFWIFSSVGFIPVLFLGAELILIYLALIIITRLLISIVSKQNSLNNIILMPAQHIFLLHLIVKAIYIRITKKYSWKGRFIYS
jgi:glycosyltransferase involved in cell wall biosynthesis